MVQCGQSDSGADGVCYVKGERFERRLQVALLNPFLGEVSAVDSVVSNTVRRPFGAVVYGRGRDG